LYKDTFSRFTNLKVFVFKRTEIGKFVLVHPILIASSLLKIPDLSKDVYRKFTIALINQYAPDILHFEFSGIGIFYLDELDKLKGKKVVSCRGSAEKVKLLIYTERQQKFRLLLDKVDAVHCVSNDMAQTISPYCTNEKKVFVNRPSIDVDFFKRTSEKKTNGYKIILSVGRMTFQKGYGNGLFAMRRLKQSSVFFNWIIVGHGNTEEELVFKTHQLGLTEEVVFAGSKSRTEVKSLMEQADIFFLPSVYEGIANVVLEAMSMEIPVVATDSGGMREVITHGVDGYIASVHDYETQAGFLLTLCNDIDKAALMGRRARKKIIESFTIQKQIDGYEQVYGSLIKNTLPTEQDVR
jgi:colanic acid/amylovoran biosynthesis glycosyltransferase